MEAIETTVTETGFKLEIFQDQDYESPASWDTFGELVAFPRLSREYTFANREANGTEIDCLDRRGFAMVERWLSLTEGGIAIPFRFEDYGSSGARLYETVLDDDPAGFIYADGDKIKEEFDGDYEKARACLVAELEAWGQYVEGDVYGYVVSDPAGSHLESCWAFYGFESVTEEGKSMLESISKADEDFRDDETEPAIERVLSCH